MSGTGHIRIDLASAVPAYRQLVDAIRKSLVSGDPAPGTMLPPVRRLAVDLGLHHNTVARAYRELADEGWLDLTRGRGASVLDRPRPRASAASVESLRSDLETLIARARAAGLSPERVADLLRETADAIGEENES